MTEIMPSNRTWDQPTEKVAEELFKNAPQYWHGALAMLFRSGLFATEAFQSTYVMIANLATTTTLYVDWDKLRADLNNADLVLSASDRAHLLFACALGLELGAQLRHLTTQGARDAEDALRFAVGR